MKTSAIIWIIVVIVVVVGGILWWMSYSSAPSYSPASSSSSYTPTSTTTTPPSTGTGSAGAGGVPQATLALDVSSNGALGNFLVAANGMTLYKFTEDKKNVSTCTGQCAVIWPPYTVTTSSSIPVALSITGTVGTIKRADGSLQVTYNGEPLYFYNKDANPGDTNGQNVQGVWFVVAP